MVQVGYKTAPFPDDMLKLGYYLGLNTDVIPAMTAKILMENVQVLHRSTYRPMTPDELLEKDENSSWPESVKSWCPASYQESWRT